MSENFHQRFNDKYKLKVERTKRDFEKKNLKFNAYMGRVSELYEMVEKTVEGTPITIEREKTRVERKMSFFQTQTEELDKLMLKLEDYYISLNPQGIDYMTGAAKLTVEHNNHREKPNTIDLFLRSGKQESEPEEDDYIWQVKIGYRNFKPFDQELLEGLLETIFLS